MIRFIFIVIFLIIYFAVSLPIQLAELIIERFSKNFRDKSSLAYVRFGFRCACAISGVKVNVKGYENIPKDEAVLFVANHASLFDIAVTYPLMERPTGYIAKKELRKIPVLSWLMYFVNCIFLDRKDPREGLKSVLKAADHIKSGVSIFLFPEGTRSKDGQLHEFKDGGMKIATKSQAPIVPVGIIGTADAFEKQFPKIRPTKVTVAFGQPIYTKDMSRSEQKNISNMVHNEVEALLQQNK